MDAPRQPRLADGPGGDVLLRRCTLKRLDRLDDRRAELRPESRNPEHGAMKLDPAKRIPNIDGVAVGAMIGASRDMPAAAASRR